MKNLTSGPVCDVAGVDWAAAWTEADRLRTTAATSDEWDRRSATYAGRTGAAVGEPGAYERAFIERAGIRPGETVLDFGCGTGLLAVPLARMGCRVVACDFSRGMLAELERNAAEAGVADAIDPHLVAWDDDWEAVGIGAESVDVAIASRSLATADMLSALRKLDRCARRRVCVSVAAGRSPRRDERVYGALGRPRRRICDHIFCLNILFQYGVCPDLSYIETRSRPAFADRAAAERELSDMVGGALCAEEKTALGTFLDEHYHFDPGADPSRAYASDELRAVKWAFISWGLPPQIPVP